MFLRLICIVGFCYCFFVLVTCLDLKHRFPPLMPTICQLRFFFFSFFFTLSMLLLGSLSVCIVKWSANNLSRHFNSLRLFPDVVDWDMCMLKNIFKVAANSEVYLGFYFSLAPLRSPRHFAQCSKQAGLNEELISELLFVSPLNLCPAHYWF